jgi:nucleoside-diphosphate-sugar epimerase
MTKRKDAVAVEDQYKDETVLVTGGAGAIGSRVVRELRNLGADVVVVDDFSSGYEFNIPEGISVIRGDISSPTTVSEAFETNPSYVFHLAAFFANQNSVDHPNEDLETNGHGIINILQASANSDSVERVVYASSSCIYDESEQLPYTESESVELTFNTPYEITKSIGEAYCNYFGKSNDVEITRARIFNSYGPGEVPGRYRNVIPNFIYLARQGEPLPITGSGEETRDFTYVSDIVSGLLSLGSEAIASGEVYNLATGEETTINELAKTINTVVGNDAGVEYQPRRDWDETERRRGSIEKVSEHVGYEPSVSISEGIKRTATWFGENWSDIKTVADFSDEVPTEGRV